MRIYAYYEFYNEDVRPLQLIIKPELGELDWSSILYIPVTGPFQRLESEQFGDLTTGSVLLSDLTRQHGLEQQIGINLPQLVRRYGIEADQLILQMNDVEEILQMEI